MSCDRGGASYRKNKSKFSWSQRALCHVTLCFRHVTYFNIHVPRNAFISTTSFKLSSISCTNNIRPTQRLLNRNIFDCEYLVWSYRRHVTFSFDSPGRIPQLSGLSPVVVLSISLHSGQCLLNWVVRIIAVNNGSALNSTLEIQSKQLSATIFVCLRTFTHKKPIFFDHVSRPHSIEKV